MTKLYCIGILLMVFLTIQAQDTVQNRYPSTLVPKGRAPGMTFKLLSENKGIKEYSIVFTKDDEVLSGLSDFAVKQNVKVSTFLGHWRFKENHCCLV